MTAVDALEPYAVALRDAAMQRVQDERGVRVEDYLTVLAAATGEAAIVSSRLFDIEDNEMAPGSAVFGDEINVVLTGDATELADMPATTVVGVLRDRLVPAVVAADDVGPIERLYRLVASSVGDVPWGAVAVTVPDDNRPMVLPLQAAFELRPVVAFVCEEAERAMAAGDLARPEGWGPHQLCALALGSAIEQTAQAIDARVAITLALEVVFGMAKTVPMSKSAFEQALDEG